MLWRWTALQYPIKKWVYSHNTQMLGTLTLE